MLSVVVIFPFVEGNYLLMVDFFTIVNVDASSFPVEESILNVACWKSDYWRLPFCLSKEVSNLNVAGVGNLNVEGKEFKCLMSPLHSEGKM